MHLFFLFHFLIILIWYIHLQDYYGNCCFEFIAISGQNRIGEICPSPSTLRSIPFGTTRFNSLHVLSDSGHICQCCKGRSKDKVLNVHHIENRKAGGDAPNNLVTLCETCHKGYHAGTVKLPRAIKRGMSFRDAAFMGIMR